MVRRARVLWVFAATLGVWTASVSAQENLRNRAGVPRAERRSDGDVSVYTYVPPPAYGASGSGVYFYGQQRIEIPGANTIDKSPYVCTLDGERFREKGAFAAHLKTKHRNALAASVDPFVVDDGQVQFIPDGLQAGLCGTLPGPSNCLPPPKP
jgi:hypothetical protein